jgi:uncharacterized protein (TIGR02246 family)
MHPINLAIAICLVPFFSFSQSERYNTKDMAALNNLVIKWDRYWNIHNMDSMGTLLRDDVDFINVAGQRLKGKKEAVTVHKERHQVVFKNSIFKSDSITIKYVKADLAIMHIVWSIVGDVDPDGKSRIPRKGIFTWVVTKTNNQWLLLAVHNVNIRETGAFMNLPEKN